MKPEVGLGFFLIGSHRLYKGLYPLWGRQIPYTMMKFASFETIVEMIYGYMPGKKSDYGRGIQTAVSFAGGYAGMPETWGSVLTFWWLTHLSWYTVCHCVASGRCNGQQAQRQPPAW